MTNQVITPPDLSPLGGGCLIVNASQLEIELLARWMPISVQDYTVYLYHEGMQETAWLSRVADQVNTILISGLTTNLAPLYSVMDQYNKINWFGDNLKYQSPVAYFIKHD
jgi:hypothetical protein